MAADPWTGAWRQRWHECWRATRTLVLLAATDTAAVPGISAAGATPEARLGTAAADAYRALRRTQHRARLDEQPTHFEPEAFAPARDAVLALWHRVFG